jgi:excisionase family DNA binding protein
MKKEEAAEFLGISVRSLQRLTQKKVITLIQKRGESGKQESFYDVDELTEYKRKRDVETVNPAVAPSKDTALARNDATQFFEMLKDAVAPKQKAGRDVAVENKPLLKLDEAAALTGLSRQILRKAIDSEELKAKLIGRAYRIKRDDLDEFIKNL